MRRPASPKDSRLYWAHRRHRRIRSAVLTGTACSARMESDLTDWQIILRTALFPRLKPGFSVRGNCTSEGWHNFCGLHCSTRLAYLCNLRPAAITAATN